MKSTMRAISEIRQQNNAKEMSKRVENEQKDESNKELDERLSKCIEARDKYKRKYNDTKNELKRNNTVYGNLAKELEANKRHATENEHLREKVTKLEAEKKNMYQGKKDLELSIKRLQNEKESLSVENNHLVVKTEELTDKISKLQKYESDFTNMVQEKEFVARENRDLKEANNQLEAKILELQAMIERTGSKNISHFGEDDKKVLEHENHLLKTEVMKLNEDILKQNQAAEQNNLTIIRQTKMAEEQASTIEDLRGDCSEMLETIQQLETENDLLSSACGDLDDNASSKLAAASISSQRGNQNQGWGEEKRVIDEQRKLINEQVTTIEQLGRERVAMLAKIEEMHGENSMLVKRSSQGDDCSVASVAIEGLLERLEHIEEMKDAEISILVEERAEMLEQLRFLENSKNKELNSMMEQNRGLAEQLENLKMQKDAERDREFTELREKISRLEIECEKLSEMNVSL